MEPMQINLGDLTDGGKVANLSGRHRGLAARTYFGLDWHSHSEVRPAVINVPAELDSITPSFLQGMFGSSMQAIGNNRDRFLEVFHFVASAHLMGQLEDGISAMLTSRDLADLH